MRRIPFAVLVLFVFALLLAPGRAPWSPTPAEAQSNGRHFPQTGYSVPDNTIWQYFQSRGGVDTFGYPISNPFRFREFTIQIFQRHVIQVVGSTARPVNLLDPDFLPIRHYGGLTFPAHSPEQATQAPAPNTPAYGQAVRDYLQRAVPNTWEGRRVGFFDYFLSSAPSGSGGNDVLFALEVWGFPTSAPARDPNNSNFIYQRFQRGIMHHDATTGVTRGILLGEAFKNVLRNENLSADLRAELSGSPLVGLYDPAQANAIAREAPNLVPPLTRANTDMRGAFNDGPPPPPPNFTRVEVYLIDLETGGPVGCGDSAVAVRRDIPATTAPLTAAIRELLSLKDQWYGESGFYNALYQSNLAIESVTLENGHADIRLVGTLRLNGVCDEPRVAEQLRATAMQFSTVRSVAVYINGERVV